MCRRLIKHVLNELGLVYWWRENQEIISLLEMYIKKTVIYTSLPAEGTVMQVCSCRSSWANHSQMRPTCQIPLMRVNSRFPSALAALTPRHISSCLLLLFTSCQYVCLLQTLHNLCAHIEIPWRPKSSSNKFSPLLSEEQCLQKYLWWKDESRDC